MVHPVCQKLAVSERWACKALGQTRSTQRHDLSPPSDELQLTNDIIDLATKYGRYGYRRINALLNSRGMAGEPQASRKDLAKRRIKVATETAEAESSLVK
jgi:putative transposase